MYVDTNTYKKRLDWSVPKSQQDQRLYGRQKESDELLQAFHRRLKTTSSRKSLLSSFPQKELILISGESGTGKTALARTLQEHVIAMGGFFIVGKFDQSQRPEPYAPFVDAFTEFVDLVEAKGQNKINEVRDAIKACIGSDSCLIMDLIPELELILGTCPSTGSSVVRGCEAQTRLKIAFRSFVRAICSPQCPLVLLMDDLQWADSGSLDMLQVLLLDDNNPGLVVVGVCRSDEVTIDHPFSAMLRHLEDNNATKILNIMLKNLTLEDTHSLISDTLRLRHDVRISQDKCKSLSNAVFGKSHGNAFYVILLLEALNSNGAFDTEANREQEIVMDNGKQHHPFQEILENNENVAGLISNKIRQQPDNVQLVLQTAACIGAEIDEYLLPKMLIHCDVGEALAIALYEGLIVEDGQCGKYVFAHDMVQQVAYSLISEEEKAFVHLSIGRSLQKKLSTNELCLHIFLIMNQFRRGVHLIDDEQEKYTLADLSYQAGAQAMSSSDFKRATSYYWLGIHLLRSNHDAWTHEYHLSLQLYNAVAEAEYCVGDFGQMDVAVEEVLNNASSFDDKIRAYSIRIYALGARQEMVKALDLGLGILHKLGEKFPQKETLPYVIGAMMKTSMKLRGKEDMKLLSLPDINDPQKVAAMSVINLITPYTYFVRENLYPIIASRIIQLTLKHGLCAISAVGFSMYGLCRLSAMNDYDGGYRYGELAISVLERYMDAGTAIEWIPRVYTTFYGMILPWKKSICDGLDKLLEAHRIGLVTGDIEFSMAAASIYLLNRFLTGTVPLHDLQEEVMHYLELMITYKQRHYGAFTHLQLQFLHNWRGMVTNPLILTGKVINQEEELHKAYKNNNKSYVSHVALWRLLLSYHLDNLDLALDMAKQSRDLEITGRGLFTIGFQYFYDALASLSVAFKESTKKRTKKQHIVNAQKCLKKLKKLSYHCPENCMFMIRLIEAELTVLLRHNKKVSEAMEKYNEAIDLSNQQGFIHMEALACERAGIALIHLYGSKNTQSQYYITRAYTLYKEWGATIKVLQMIDKFKDMEVYDRREFTEATESSCGGTFLSS